jgi:hypothetical protein
MKALVPGRFADGEKARCDRHVSLLMCAGPGCLQRQPALCAYEL